MSEKKEVVVVLGMHRSGTSAIANAISEMGYYLGEDLLVKDKNNEKGYFENTDIVLLNSMICASNGENWDCVTGINYNFDNMKSAFFDKALNIMKELLENNDSIAIKDPRICKTLPVWQEVFRFLDMDVKYVYVYRNPMSAAGSLNKRDGMDINIAEKLWFHYNYRALEHVDSEIYKINFDKLIENPDEELNDLSLYLRNSEFKQRNIIDKKLRHNSKKDKDTYSYIYANNLYKKLNSVDPIIRKAVINSIILEFNDVINSIKIEQHRVNVLAVKNEERIEHQTINLQSYSDNIEIKCDLSEHEIISSIILLPSAFNCVIDMNNISVYNENNNSIEFLIISNATYNNKITYVFEDCSPFLELIFEPQKVKSIIFDAKIEDSIMLYNIMHKEQNIINNTYKEQNKDYEAKLNKVLTELKKQQNRAFINAEMILLNIKIIYKYIKNIFRNSKYIRAFKASCYFDAEYYMEKNKDLKKLRVNPYLHYLFFGGIEGRNPSKDFDTNFYSNRYEDVKKGIMNPLYHFIAFGKYEARITRENFSRGLEFNENYRYKYSKFNRKYKNLQNSFEKKPLISVLLYINDNLSVKILKSTLESIKNQWYNNVEICIAIENEADKEIIKYINRLENKKIKVARNSNGLEDAYKLSNGSYVAVLRAMDHLTPNALYEVAKRINEKDADFIYSDEDKISSSGNYRDPHFKTDFSYDMFLSYNYIGYFAVISKEILSKVEKPFNSKMGKAECYDAYLKVFENTERIEHIQKVLYHKRAALEVLEKEKSLDQYIDRGYKKAIETHLERLKIEAKVFDGILKGSYRVCYDIVDDPLVSIIIPFKDNGRILASCVKSIIDNSTYKNYEIILVRNNSSKKDTFKMIDDIKSWDERIKVFEYNVPFNYSKINNYAVKNFLSGEYILFLNNDTEVLVDDWIEGMLGFACQEDVGAVGAKLFYPNNSIQTAGVCIGIYGGCGEFHKFFHKKSDGYFGRLKLNQNVSAVSAACMMVRKDKFIEVGCFDEENFSINCNDLDLCFKLIEKGYRNVFTPYVELYHYESLTRTIVMDNIDKNEQRALREIYKEWIKNGDRYYNPNLSNRIENFELKSIN